MPNTYIATKRLPRGHALLSLIACPSAILYGILFTLGLYAFKVFAMSVARYAGAGIPSSAFVRINYICGIT